MKNKVELIKRFDEHECILTWSSSSPAAFITVAIDDFKSFVLMKIKEQEDQKSVQESPKEV